jgi:predicted ATPase
VTGDAVTVAKRLEEAAGAGEILIGEATRALVEEAARLEPVGPVELKGKPEPVTAWRLLEVSPDGAGVRRRLDTPLVGRTVELARLNSAFEETVAEQGCRLVTVLGVAGIGKSRLAAELFAAVGERATVLVGRCLPYGEGITFWPLVELIRAAGGAAALGEEDAEAAATLDTLLEPDAEPASSDEIFWAARRLLETLAAQRPVVVCFEDIHWAEPTFLDLLEYLAAFVRRGPVLLLCQARPELAERRSSWLSGPVIRLEPLSEHEAETLLDGLGELDPEARRRIGEAAEGNPFFAEQLAALALEGGSSTLPPTVQALLAERLDRLETGERAVIERAAIVGREFSRGAVAELAPDTLRAEVGAHLLALTRKDLIRPDDAAGPREDGFRFRHILVREAAYEAAPKSLRA